MSSKKKQQNPSGANGAETDDVEDGSVHGEDGGVEIDSEEGNDPDGENLVFPDPPAEGLPPPPRMPLRAIRSPPPTTPRSILVN